MVGSSCEEYSVVVDYVDREYKQRYHVFEHHLSFESVHGIFKRFQEDKVFMVRGKLIDPSVDDVVGFHVYDVNRNDVTRRFDKSLPNKTIVEPPKGKVTSKPSPPLSKKVFIVHGRDDEPLNELKVILKQLGLNSVVLHEQPSGSRTIIEKLERYSDVGYAFVILTPDDIGGSQKEIYGTSLAELTDSTRPLTEIIDVIYKTDNKMSRFKLLEKFSEFFTNRPRQNVVLEFGYFIGKLGRDKVCCLYKGDIDLPSDMHGINYIPFKESVEEVLDKVVKELKAVGYEIKI